MLSLETLTIFSAACLALTATPGPDMLLIVSRTVSQGRVAGFATLAGIQTGTYFHALVAALGLSRLFLSVPLAYNAVRLAGATYLLYLAWKTLRSTQDTMWSKTGASQSQPVRYIFNQGLLTNLLNPKMALFVLALFPQFVQQKSAESVVAQILQLATVLNVIGLLVNGTVIMLASRLANRYRSSGFPSRLPQYLLGGVFFGLACRLALSESK